MKRTDNTLHIQSKENADKIGRIMDDLEVLMDAVMQSRDDIERNEKELRELREKIAHQQTGQANEPETVRLEVTTEPEQKNLKDVPHLDPRPKTETKKTEAEIKKVEELEEKIENLEDEILGRLKGISDRKESEKPLKSSEKDKERYDCPICGNSYSKKTFVRHLKTHGIDTEKMFETEDGYSVEIDGETVKAELYPTFKHKLAKSDKWPNMTTVVYQKVKESDNPLKELGVQEEQEEEESEPVVEIPDFEEQQKLEPSKYGVSKRKVEMVKLLEEKGVPLTNEEMARFIYNIPEDVEVRSGGKYYNRMIQAIAELKREDVIREGDRENLTGRIKAWELNPERDTMKLANGTESTSKELDFEQVKNDANVSDSDMDIVKQAFDQILNERGKDKIDFHLFEQHYQGETTPMRMYQKLFGNPKLLNYISEQVLEGRELSWSKKEGNKGSGVKTWEVEIK